MFSRIQHLLDQFRHSASERQGSDSPVRVACDPVQSSKLSEFFEKLDVLEASYVERLCNAIEAMESGYSAHAQLDDLLITLAQNNLDLMLARVLSSFCLALKCRAKQHRTGGGNLYLGARPPGRQLRAFELLRLRTPLIPFAYAAANRALSGYDHKSM